ncbi:endo-1,4-beta-xylanase xylA, putative (macronuclear) [Tetrahymena thermophila SB210]|uniref:Endo-1,4-beta-xylanase xylA, putative n=1 Tax=Tetrahymena thermophila (strain SB210) TaxID=312017 RepID=Q22DQ0_TETTS|nr:endo-1,4-beta-xylanase xylA, putative [Tetrahymena thermophila SB210]EAR83404.2 endo-1,4-beta-xylanase xylA, putative [Tetrahymena thermophila SB210]|eukprot:XP_001031067.2 endo-1,4-beta-xylanase xylA, putative [Tetrahymena thermophila SB210]
MNNSNLRHQTLSVAALPKQGEIRTTQLLEYTNGIFQGQMSGYPLKKNGLGVFAFDNGDFYFGEWENDQLQGEGILFFAFGGFVHGFFEKSKLHGPAFLKFSNGEIYEGYWNNGLIDGEAYNYFIDENLWLKCQYSNGKFQNLLEEGEGRAPSNVLANLSEMKSISDKHKTPENPRVKILDFKDGQQFLGAANKNKTCGLGILRRLDGKCDIGFCDDGRFVDVGRINLKDGGLYDGLLKNGKFNGRGMYYNPKDKSWFYGHFENGECKKISKQGQGKYPLQIVEQIRAQHHKKSNRYVDQIVAPNVFYVPTGYNRNQKQTKETEWQPQKIEQMREKTFSHRKSPKLIRSLYVHEQVFKDYDDLSQRQKMRMIQSEKAMTASPNSKLYQHYLQKSANSEQDENIVKRSGNKKDGERDKRSSPMQNQMYPNQINNRGRQISPFNKSDQKPSQYYSPQKTPDQLKQMMNSSLSSSINNQKKGNQNTQKGQQTAQPLQASKVQSDPNQNYINIQDSYDMSIEGIPYEKEERQKKSKLSQQQINKIPSQSSGQDNKFIIIDQNPAQVQSFSSPTFNQQQLLTQEQAQKHLQQMQQQLHPTGEKELQDQKISSEKKFQSIESGNSSGDQQVYQNNQGTNFTQFDTKNQMGQKNQPSSTHLISSNNPQTQFRKNTFGEEMNQDLPDQKPFKSNSMHNQASRPIDTIGYSLSPTVYSTINEQPFQSEYQSQKSQNKDQFLQSVSQFNNPAEQQQFLNQQSQYNRRPLSQSLHSGLQKTEQKELFNQKIPSETRLSQQISSSQSIDQNPRKLRLSQYIANNVEEPIKQLVKKAIETDNNSEFLQKYRNVLFEDDPKSTFSDYQDLVSARNKIILNKIEQNKLFSLEQAASHQDDLISFQTSIIGLQDQFISKQKRSKSLMSSLQGGNLHSPVASGVDIQSQYESTYRTNLDSQRDNKFISQNSQQLVSNSNFNTNNPAAGLNLGGQNVRYSSQPNLQRLNLTSQTPQDQYNILQNCPPLSGKSNYSQQNYGHQASIQSHASQSSQQQNIILDTLQSVRGPNSNYTQFKDQQMHYQSTSPSVQQYTQSPSTQAEQNKQKDVQQKNDKAIQNQNQVSQQFQMKRDGSPLTPKQGIIKDPSTPRKGVSPKSVRFSQEIQNQQAYTQHTQESEENQEDQKQNSTKVTEMTFQQQKNNDNVPQIVLPQSPNQQQNQKNEFEQIANFMPDTPQKLNPQLNKVKDLLQHQASYISQNSQISNPKQLIRQVESFFSRQSDDQAQIDPKAKDFITKLRNNSPESQQILQTFSSLPQEQRQEYIQKQVTRQAESQIQYEYYNDPTNQQQRNQQNQLKNLQHLHSRSSSLSSENRSQNNQNNQDNNYNFNQSNTQQTTGNDQKPPIHRFREVYSTIISPKNTNEQSQIISRQQSGDFTSNQGGQIDQQREKQNQNEPFQRTNMHQGSIQNQQQVQRQSPNQKKSEFYVDRNNQDNIDSTELQYSSQFDQNDSVRQFPQRTPANTITFNPNSNQGIIQQGSYYSPDTKQTNQGESQYIIQGSTPLEKQGSQVMNQTSPGLQNNLSAIESCQYSQSNLNYSQSPEQIRLTTNDQQNTNSNNNSFRQSIASNNQSNQRLISLQQQYDQQNIPQNEQIINQSNIQDKSYNSKNQFDQTLPDEVCEDFENINIGNFTERNSEEKQSQYNDQQGQQSFIGENIRVIDRSSYQSTPDRPQIVNTEHQQALNQKLQQNLPNQANNQINKFQEYQQRQEQSLQKIGSKYEDSPQDLSNFIEKNNDQYLQNQSIQSTPSHLHQDLENQGQNQSQKHLNPQSQQYPQQEQNQNNQQKQNSQMGIPQNQDQDIYEERRKQQQIPFSKDNLEHYENVQQFYNQNPQMQNQQLSPNQQSQNNSIKQSDKEQISPQMKQNNKNQEEYQIKNKQNQGEIQSQLINDNSKRQQSPQQKGNEQIQASSEYPDTIYQKQNPQRQPENNQNLIQGKQELSPYSSQNIKDIQYAQQIQQQQKFISEKNLQDQDSPFQEEKVFSGQNVSEKNLTSHKNLNQQDSELQNSPIITQKSQYKSQDRSFLQSQDNFKDQQSPYSQQNFSQKEDQHQYQQQQQMENKIKSKHSPVSEGNFQSQNIQSQEFLSNSQNQNKYQPQQFDSPIITEKSIQQRQGRQITIDQSQINQNQLIQSNDQIIFKDQSSPRTLQNMNAGDHQFQEQHYYQQQQQKQEPMQERSFTNQNSVYQQEKSQNLSSQNERGVTNSQNQIQKSISPRISHQSQYSSQERHNITDQQQIYQQDDQVQINQKQQQSPYTSQSRDIQNQQYSSQSGGDYQFQQQNISVDNQKDQGGFSASSQSLKSQNLKNQQIGQSKQYFENQQFQEDEDSNPQIKKSSPFNQSKSISQNVDEGQSQNFTNQDNYSTHKSQENVILSQSSVSPQKYYSNNQLDSQKPINQVHQQEYQQQQYQISQSPQQHYTPQSDISKKSVQNQQTNLNEKDISPSRFSQNKNQESINISQQQGQEISQQFQQQGQFSSQQLSSQRSNLSPQNLQFSQKQQNQSQIDLIRNNQSQELNQQSPSHSQGQYASRQSNKELAQNLSTNKSQGQSPQSLSKNNLDGFQEAQQTRHIQQSHNQSQQDDSQYQSPQSQQRKIHINDQSQSQFNITQQSPYQQSFNPSLQKLNTPGYDQNYSQNMINTPQINNQINKGTSGFQENEQQQQSNQIQMKSSEKQNFSTGQQAQIVDAKESNFSNDNQYYSASGLSSPNRQPQNSNKTQNLNDQSNFQIRQNDSFQDQQKYDYPQNSQRPIVYNQQEVSSDQLQQQDENPVSNSSQRQNVLQSDFKQSPISSDFQQKQFRQSPYNQEREQQYFNQQILSNEKSQGDSQIQSQKSLNQEQQQQANSPFRQQNTQSNNLNEAQQHFISQQSGASNNDRQLSSPQKSNIPNQQLQISYDQRQQSPISNDFNMKSQIKSPYVEDQQNKSSQSMQQSPFSREQEVKNSNQVQNNQYSQKDSSSTLNKSPYSENVNQDQTLQEQVERQNSPNYQEDKQFQLERQIIRQQQPYSSSKSPQSDLNQSIKNQIQNSQSPLSNKQLMSSDKTRQQNDQDNYEQNEDEYEDNLYFENEPVVKSNLQKSQVTNTPVSTNQVEDQNKDFNKYQPQEQGLIQGTSKQNLEDQQSLERSIHKQQPYISSRSPQSLSNQQSANQKQSLQSPYSQKSPIQSRDQQILQSQQGILNQNQDEQNNYLENQGLESSQINLTPSRSQISAQNISQYTKSPQNQSSNIHDIHPISQQNVISSQITDSNLSPKFRQEEQNVQQQQNIVYNPQQIQQRISNSPVNQQKISSPQSSILYSKDQLSEQKDTLNQMKNPSSPYHQQRQFESQKISGNQSQIQELPQEANLQNKGESDQGYFEQYNEQSPQIKGLQIKQNSQGQQEYLSKSRHSSSPYSYQRSDQQEQAINIQQKRQGSSENKQKSQEFNRLDSQNQNQPIDNNQQMFNKSQDNYIYEQQLSPISHSQISQISKGSPVKQSYQQELQTPEKLKNQVQKSSQYGEKSDQSPQQSESLKQKLNQTNQSQFNLQEDQTTNFKPSSSKQLNKSQDIFQESQQISPYYESNQRNQELLNSPYSQNINREAYVDSSKNLNEELRKESKRQSRQSISPVNTPRTQSLAKQLDPSIDASASRYLSDKQYSSVVVREDVQALPLSQSIKKSQEEFVKSPNKTIYKKVGSLQSPPVSPNLSPNMKSSNAPIGQINQPYSARTYGEQTRSSNIYSQLKKGVSQDGNQMFLPEDVSKQELFANPLYNIQSPIQLVTGIYQNQGSAYKQFEPQHQGGQEIQNLQKKSSQGNISLIPNVHSTAQSQGKVSQSLTSNQIPSSNIYASQRIGSIDTQPNTKANIGAYSSEYPIGFEQYANNHKKQQSQSYSQEKIPDLVDKQQSSHEQRSSSPIYYQTLSPNESHNSRQIIQKQLQNLRQSQNLESSKPFREDSPRSNNNKNIIFSQSQMQQKPFQGQRSRQSSEGNIQQQIIQKKGYISPVSTSRRQSQDELIKQESNNKNRPTSSFNISQQFQTIPQQQDQRFQTTYSNSYSSIPTLAYKSNSESKQIQQSQRKFSNPILQTEEIPRPNFQNLPEYLQSPQQKQGQFSGKKLNSEKYLSSSSRRQSYENLTSSQNNQLVQPPYAVDTDLTNYKNQQRPPSFSHSDFVFQQQANFQAKNSYQPDNQYQFEPSQNYDSNYNQFNEQKQQQQIQSMTTKTKISPNVSGLFSNNAKSINDMQLDFQQGSQFNLQSNLPSFQPILSPLSNSQGNFTQQRQQQNPFSQQTLLPTSPLFFDQQQQQTEGDQQQKRQVPYFQSQKSREKPIYPSSKSQDQYGQSIPKIESSNNMQVSSQQNKIIEPYSIESQSNFKSNPYSDQQGYQKQPSRQDMSDQSRANQVQQKDELYMDRQSQLYNSGNQLNQVPFSYTVQVRDSNDQYPYSQNAIKSSTIKSPIIEDNASLKSLRDSRNQFEKKEQQQYQGNRQNSSNQNQNEQKDKNTQNQTSTSSQYQGYYIPKKMDIPVTDILNEKSSEQISRQSQEELFRNSPLRSEAEKKQNIQQAQSQIPYIENSSNIEEKQQFQGQNKQYQFEQQQQEKERGISTNRQKDAQLITNNEQSKYQNQFEQRIPEQQKQSQFIQNNSQSQSSQQQISNPHQQSQQEFQIKQLESGISTNIQNDAQKILSNEQSKYQNQLESRIHEQQKQNQFVSNNPQSQYSQQQLSNLPQQEYYPQIQGEFNQEMSFSSRQPIERQSIEQILKNSQSKYDKNLKSDNKFDLSSRDKHSSAIGQQQNDSQNSFQNQVSTDKKDKVSLQSQLEVSDQTFQQRFPTQNEYSIISSSDKKQISNLSQGNVQNYYPSQVEMNEQISINQSKDIKQPHQQIDEPTKHANYQQQIPLGNFQESKQKQLTNPQNQEKQTAQIFYQQDDRQQNKIQQQASKEFAYQQDNKDIYMPDKQFGYESKDIQSAQKLTDSVKNEQLNTQNQPQNYSRGSQLTEAQLVQQKSSYQEINRSQGQGIIQINQSQEKRKDQITSNDSFANRQFISEQKEQGINENNDLPYKSNMGIINDNLSYPSSQIQGLQYSSYQSRPNQSPDNKQQSINMSSSFQAQDPFNRSSYNKSMEFLNKSGQHLTSSLENKDQIPQNIADQMNKQQTNQIYQTQPYNQPYFPTNSNNQIESKQNYVIDIPSDLNKTEQSDKKKSKSPNKFEESQSLFGEKAPLGNYSIPKTYQSKSSAFDNISYVNNPQVKSNALNEGSFGAPKYQNTQSISSASYQSSPPNKQQASINISQDISSGNQLKYIIPLNSEDAKNREKYLLNQPNQSVEYYSAGSVNQYPQASVQNQQNLENSLRSQSSPQKNIQSQFQNDLQERQSSLPPKQQVSTLQEQMQIPVANVGNIGQKEVSKQALTQSSENERTGQQKDNYQINEAQHRLNTDQWSLDQNFQGLQAPKMLNSQSSQSNNRYTTPMQTAQFNSQSFDELSDASRKQEQKINNDNMSFSQLGNSQQKTQRQNSPLKSQNQGTLNQLSEREQVPVSNQQQMSIPSSSQKDMQDISELPEEFKKQSKYQYHNLGVTPLPGTVNNNKQNSQQGLNSFSMDNKSLNQQNPLDDSYRTVSQNDGREPQSSSLFNPLMSANTKNQMSKNKTNDNTSQWYSQNNDSNYQTFQSPQQNQSSSSVQQQQQQDQHNFITKPSKNAQLFSRVSEFPYQQQNTSYLVKGFEDDRISNQNIQQQSNQSQNQQKQNDSLKNSYVEQKIRASDIEEQGKQQNQGLSPLPKQNQYYPGPQYNSINNEDEVNYRTIVSHGSVSTQGLSAQKQYQSQRQGDISQNQSFNDSPSKNIRRINQGNSGQPNQIRERLDNIRNIESKIKQLSENIMTAVNESQQQIKLGEQSYDSVREESKDQVPENYEETTFRNQDFKESYKKSRAQQKQPYQNESVQNRGNQSRYNQDVEGSLVYDNAKQSHRHSPYSQMFGHSDNSTTYIPFNSPNQISPLIFPNDSNQFSLYPNSQNNIPLSYVQQKTKSAPLVPGDHRYHSQPHQMQNINLSNSTQYHNQAPQQGTQYQRQNAQIQYVPQQHQSHIYSPIKLQQSTSASPYRQQVLIRTPVQQQTSPIQQSYQIPGQIRQVVQSTSPYGNNQKKQLSPIQSSHSGLSNNQNNTPIRLVQKEVIYKTQSPIIISDHQQRSISANRLATEVINQSVNNLNQTVVSQGISPLRNPQQDDSFVMKQSKGFNLSQSIVSPVPGTGQHIIISPIRDNYMYHSLAMSRQIPLSPNINPLSSSIANGNSPQVSKTPLEFIKFYTPQKQQMFRSERLHTASPEKKNLKEIEKIQQKTKTRTFLSCCKNENTDEGEVEIEQSQGNLLTLQQIKQQQLQQQKEKEDENNCNIY